MSLGGVQIPLDSQFDTIEMFASAKDLSKIDSGNYELSIE